MDALHVYEVWIIRGQQGHWDARYVVARSYAEAGHAAEEFAAGRKVIHISDKDEAIFFAGAEK